MSKDDFIQIVQQSEFLNEERKKLMIDNAGWMSAGERAILAKSIGATQAVFDKNNELMVKELEKVEEAIKVFKTKELPKLVKAAEKSEEKGEEEEAEALIKSL